MSARRLIFGPFEFDVRTAGLRKQGVRIRLPLQAARILLMLLEHPGEVVLRSEIREKLWPGDTVVEFDQSINAAVKRLRNALGDSADSPRYIETVAKQGYRFVAQVRQLAGAPSLPETPLPELPPSAVEAKTEPEQLVEPFRPSVNIEPAELPQPVRVTRRAPWLRMAAALAGLATIAAFVYFRPGGRLREQPSLRAVPLTTLPGEQNFPAFSPDGEKIAFSWVGPPKQDGLPTMNIYVKSILSGETVPVTTGPTEDRFPHWSPDGKEIAFQRTTPSGFELMIVPSSGGAGRKLADMGIGLAWSPEGSEIAYVARYFPLMVLSLKTGRVRQLTKPQPLRERGVAWSPDGKYIAFTRELGGPVRELFVIPSQGGEARQLTFDRRSVGGFNWTPDSRELVFNSNRDAGSTLWRIALGGGSPERVAYTASHPAFPVVSIRGNRLAYSDFFVDSNIWRYEFKGPVNAAQPVAGPPKCLICSSVEDDSPKFSPDGRQLVFVSWRSGSEEIWLADTDGSHPRQLTSMGARAGSPRWSPDGRWIAFDSTAQGSPEIYVISVAGGAPRQLTPEPSLGIEPSWSHDGQWIYFASERGGSAHIWKAPFAGGPAVQVTQGDGGESIESTDGRRLYYFRRRYNQGLWSVPVPTEGGPEEPIPELRSVWKTRAWTVRAEGIYFFEVADGKSFIRLFDFATRRVRTVLAPAFPVVVGNPGLDISPDGRTLLYTQVDRRVDGLMMIENFR